MNIPDEAVEAAAKALALADGWTELDWNMVPARFSRRFYDLARTALEAAAPQIAAQALRKASDAYPLETAYGGAEHAVIWLKERADQIEAPATAGASALEDE